MTVLLKVAWVALLVGETLLAQVGALVCDSSVQFDDRNMVDYTLKIRSMRGKVIDIDAVGISNACLALFNSDHSKLLRTFQTNKNGEFLANDIKSGDYWLVVRDPQNVFCPASTRIRLRSMLGKSRLVVDMRARGIDRCSFCEAK